MILEKAALTGGMVLVSPGTSLQVMIAILIVLCYFGLVLRYGPYKEDAGKRAKLIVDF